jgi:hypothetical protein
MLQPRKNKQATKEDSLAVYNQSKKVENFYIQDDYVKGMKATKALTSKAHKTNDAINAKFKNNTAKNSANGIILSSFSSVDKADYRKNIDSNRYKQREQANSLLNLDAPIQLFDRRIEPKGGNIYNKKGDKVQIFSYNTIANKPFDMLTSKEKEQRVKEYGREGVPNSYKPILATKNGIITGKKIAMSTSGKQAAVLESRFEPNVVKRTLIKPLTALKKEGLISDNTISSSDINISTAKPFIKPKSYKVEETTPVKFGGHKTTYEVSDASNISDAIMTGDNKRVITPRYKKGGKINNKKY